MFGIARLPATTFPASTVSEYRRGVAYALAAGIALGLLGPVSKVAFGEGMGSSTFAALRATIGALTLAVIVLPGGPRLALRDLSLAEWRSLALVAGAQAALSLSLFAAYHAMDVALVLAVYFSYPVIVCLASVALGRERLTPVRVAALGMSLTGLVLVVCGHLTPGTAPSMAGLALAGIAAACQATYLVASRHGFTRVPSTQAVTLILAGAAALMWLLAIPSDGPGGTLVAWVGSPAAWLAIAIAGILGAAAAKVWMLRGVRRVGGTRASVLMLAEPITGAVAAALVLAAPLGPLEVVGGVMVLAGAALAQRPAPPAR